MRYPGDKKEEGLILNSQKPSQLQNSIPHGKPKKSIILGATLGLLGPVGWFYSGSWKETIPASIVTLVVLSISLLKPIFLLLLPILLPLSALVGGIYAWSYNRAGERYSLLLDSGKK